ncbi:hypothetical protein BP5796_05750 [Coleophoma crateriformis]|uniref:Uncharacterized protein n=1 Tax=Coleophoma crateriformis TaxID=565419 RepID=A0A3D8RV89_9HELO|nr:hypothetical protein BP5796_05750 [Coleophoma crateriformis]
MGIPYSRQIHLAFDQVTPLVAAGFQVLETTKNITFLLAAVQVLNTVFLGLILVVLLALLITVNPDIEYERQVLVTPVVKSLADLVIRYGRTVQIGMWIVLIGASLGAAAGWYVTREATKKVEVVEVGPEDETKVGDTETA